MSLDRLDEMLRADGKPDFHEVTSVIRAITVTTPRDVERLLTHIEAPEQAWTWALVERLESCLVERETILRRLVPLLSNRGKSVVEHVFRVAATMPKESGPYAREFVDAVSRLVRAAVNDPDMGVCATGCLRTLDQLVHDPSMLMDFLRTFPWHFAAAESHAFADSFNAIAMELLARVASADPTYALTILRRALAAPLPPIDALGPVGAAERMAPAVPGVLDVLIQDTARLEQAGPPENADAHTRMMHAHLIKTRHNLIRKLRGEPEPKPKGNRDELPFPTPEDAITIDPVRVGILALPRPESIIGVVEHAGEIWAMVRIGPAGVPADETSIGTDRFEARRVITTGRVPAFADVVPLRLDMPNHATTVPRRHRFFTPLWVEKGLAFVGMMEPLPHGKERALVLVFDLGARRWLNPLDREFTCPGCSRRGEWKSWSVYENSDTPIIPRRRGHDPDETPDHADLHPTDSWSPYPTRNESNDWVFDDETLYRPDVLLRLASERRWTGMAPLAAPRLPDGTIIAFGPAFRSSPDERAGSDDVIARFPVDVSPSGSPKPLLC